MIKANKCDYCKKESTQTHLFDLNWIRRDMKEGDIVPRGEMDLKRYCTINCQENDLKKRGLFDDYMKRVIERNPSLASG